LRSLKGLYFVPGKIKHMNLVEKVVRDIYPPGVSDGEIIRDMVEGQSACKLLVGIADYRWGSDGGMSIVRGINVSRYGIYCHCRRADEFVRVAYRRTSRADVLNRPRCYARQMPYGVVL